MVGDSEQLVEGLGDKVEQQRDLEETVIALTADTKNPIQRIFHVSPKNVLGATPF